MRVLGNLLTLSAMALAALSCGSEPNPTSPREARFTINPGLLNRSFTVIDISAVNAQHTFAPPVPNDFAAPYRILLENAVPPVQGIFQPATEDAISDVQLIFGGETVPRVVSNPLENSRGCPTPTSLPAFFCINSGAAPIPPSFSNEVRFDVSGTAGTSFLASVGDVNATHLIDQGSLPATVYLEQGEAQVTGVFTKVDIQGELLARLYINGVEVDAAFSEANKNVEAVVNGEL